MMFLLRVVDLLVVEVYKPSPSELYYKKVKISNLGLFTMWRAFFCLDAVILKCRFGIAN
jgi:hypothetical protein